MRCGGCGDLLFLPDLIEDTGALEQMACEAAWRLLIINPLLVSLKDGKNP